MTAILYRFATLMRPAGPGAIPREGLWACQDYENLVLPSGHHAYDVVTYGRKLTQKEIDDYELEFIDYQEVEE